MRQKAEDIAGALAFLLPSSKEFQIISQESLHCFSCGISLLSASRPPLPKAIGFCGGNLGGGGLGGTWDGLAGLSDMGHLLMVP